MYLDKFIIIPQFESHDRGNKTLVFLGNKFFYSTSSEIQGFFIQNEWKRKYEHAM